jgi:hypothetical protein
MDQKEVEYRGAWDCKINATIGPLWAQNQIKELGMDTKLHRTDKKRRHSRTYIKRSTQACV